MMQEYRGLKNYETWNVLFWITEVSNLYDLAKQSGKYRDFVDQIKKVDGRVGRCTPDNVAWDHPEIDTEALDKVIAEFFNQ